MNNREKQNAGGKLLWEATIFSNTKTQLNSTGFHFQQEHVITPEIIQNATGTEAWRMFSEFKVSSYEVWIYGFWIYSTFESSFNSRPIFVMFLCVLGDILLNHKLIQTPKLYLVVHGHL